MKVAIQDASILFDLECSGLLPLWFQLGIETHVSALIEREIDPARHVHLYACIQSKQIVVHAMTADEEFKANMVAAEVGGLTKADASCCLLAVKIKAMLLTGDQRLRNYSQRQGVEAHGILWVFDQLMEAGLLNSRFAAQKLAALMEENSFLPDEECKKRIARWSKME